MDNFIKIPVRTTYLELFSSNYHRIPLSIENNELSIIRIGDISINFYKYLYKEVGEQFGWASRLVLSNDELFTIINSENTFIYVLYAKGVPVGFAELNKPEAEGIELKYFGLVQTAQGKGIANYFFQTVIETVWSMNMNRIYLQTCELDSPKALPFYLKIGFKEYKSAVCSDYYPKEFVEKLNLESLGK